MFGVIDGRRRVYGFGIRLEDCTGESLRTLPQDDDSEDERSDDDYDDDNDDDGGECIMYILSKLRDHRRRLNFLYGRFIV